MFIPGNAGQYFGKTSSESEQTKTALSLKDTGMATGANIKNNLDWVEISTNYTHENRFFKGFFIILPVSIGMWVAIIWGVKTLIF